MAAADVSRSALAPLRRCLTSRPRSLRIESLSSAPFAECLKSSCIAASDEGGTFSFAGACPRELPRSIRWLPSRRDGTPFAAPSRRASGLTGLRSSSADVSPWRWTARQPTSSAAFASVRPSDSGRSGISSPRLRFARETLLRFLLPGVAANPERRRQLSRFRCRPGYGAIPISTRRMEPRAASATAAARILSTRIMTCRLPDLSASA